MTRIIIGPNLLKIIEASHLWPKQMHDNVTKVEQHPIGIGQAFKLWRTACFFFDFLRKMVCD